MSLHNVRKECGDPDETNPACLDLGIAGHWTTQDFLLPFGSLDRLYVVAYRFRWRVAAQKGARG